MGSFGISEGNITREKKKNHHHLTATACREVAQMLISITREGDWTGRRGWHHWSLGYRLPVANHVFLGSCMVDICQEGRSLRSAPKRRHTAHLRQCPCGTPRKRAAGTREVPRCTAHLGQCARQAPGHLSCSDLGRAQNACPTESVPLWRTREPKPEQLRTGKCTKPRAYFGQFPCRATWSLSSVDQESTHAVSWGKPSVVHTL